MQAVYNTPSPNEPIRDLGVRFSSKGRRSSLRFDFPPGQVRQVEAYNILYCTSERQSRRPLPYEVMLDVEDGLNWETFCDCSIMWVVERSSLSHKCGRVTLERRRTIRAALRDTFLLLASD